MEVDFEREDYSNCVTYRDAAMAISKIKDPVGSQLWLDQAARMIKRYGHHEKLSVYSRVRMWIYGFRPQDSLNLETVKWAVDAIENKIATHQDFSTRKDKEIM